MKSKKRCLKLTTNAYIRKINNHLKLNKLALSFNKDEKYFYRLRTRYKLKYNMILGNHINHTVSYQIFKKEYENYKLKLEDIYFNGFDSSKKFINWLISLKIYKSNRISDYKRNLDTLIFSYKPIIDYSEQQLLIMEKIVKTYEEIKHQ